MKLIDKKLANLKAAQERGSYTLCPRCGRDTMKHQLYTNALSGSRTSWSAMSAAWMKRSWHS